MNDQPRDDDQVRHLLHDAVDDVEPAPGLETIRSRTTVSALRARRPWFVAAGAAVVATAATIAVVTVIGNQGPTATPGPAAGGSASASDTSSASASPSTSTTGGDLPIPVYYVGDTSHGPRLYREIHGTLAAPTSDVAAEAVRDAVAGSPEDPDYTSLWPAGTDVQHVEATGGAIVVDLKDAALLHDRPAGMSQEQARLSVQQVVRTVDGVYQDSSPVRFLLDGRPADRVLGVPTSGPVARAADTDVLAQVWITAPDQGAIVQSGFKVEGLAAAFEANVQWELEQGGTVVKSGFTTAAECCTMAPYSFTVAAPPGDYTLVVHDSDPSGGEGPAPWQDTKDVTITP